MSEFEKLFGLDKLPPPVDPDQRTLTDGSAVTPDHRDIQPDGQQKAYVVLSEAERAKGFVRPVRHRYRHVGPPGPKFSLRDLTPAEHQRYSTYGYVKFEAYPRGSTIVGQFWTQANLDQIGKGCGTVTTMNQALAETYARSPTFYSGTYCCGCQRHFPVGEDGEFVWDDCSEEKVGT